MPFKPCALNASLSESAHSIISAPALGHKAVRHLRQQHGSLALHCKMIPKVMVRQRVPAMLWDMGSLSIAGP